jgi:hypothetical protein
MWAMRTVLGSILSWLLVTETGLEAGRWVGSGSAQGADHELQDASRCGGLECFKSPSGGGSKWVLRVLEDPINTRRDGATSSASRSFQGALRRGGTAVSRLQDRICLTSAALANELRQVLELCIPNWLGDS